MVRQEYTKVYLREVLKSHGYTPQNVDGGWLQFAMSLIIAEKLDHILQKLVKKTPRKAVASKK